MDSVRNRCWVFPVILFLFCDLACESSVPMEDGGQPAGGASEVGRGGAFSLGGGSGTPPAHDAGSDGTSIPLDAAVTKPVEIDSGDSTVPADEVPVTVDICDGSGGVRLNYQISAPKQPTEVGRDTSYVNYLVVAGDCRYWSLPAAWGEARTGTLSAETARALAKDVHYGDWSRLSGTYSGTQPIYDAQPSVVSDGAHRLVCAGVCDAKGSTVPDVFKRLVEWRDRLYEDGSAVRGSIRATALFLNFGSYSSTDRPIAWPLRADVSEFAVDPTTPMGPNPGKLVEVAEELNVLRDLRKQKNDRSSVWHNYAYIPVQPDAPPGRYELYFRDVAEAEALSGYERF
jgi:hypothetical protein